jgi:hypothetical protein
VKRLAQAAIALALLAAATGAARGDLCAQAAAEASARPQPAARTVPQPQAFDGLDLATLAPRPEVAPPEPVATLPEEPASLQLLLCGLGSLGAYQLGRTARKFHLLHVPEWYHADGPFQVGHAVAADPDLSGALTPCTFDAPDQEDHLLLLFYRRLSPPPVHALQCILSTEAPRGPPLRSC